MSTDRREARPRRAAPGERSGLSALLAATPARLAIGRSGPRLRTASYLDIIAAHGRARDAVTSEVPAALVRSLGLVEIATAARTRTEHVAVPTLGRRLDASARVRLRRCRRRPEVQLALTDGLSSAAIVHNGGALLRALTRLLRARPPPRHAALRPQRTRAGAGRDR